LVLKKLAIIAPLVLAGLIGAGSAEAATIYTVQSGDTMSKISQKLGVTLSSLESANTQITNFNNIWVGETINVPSTTSTWQAKADAIIATAKKYIGVPYQYGATYGNTSSFDCSSFTEYVFAQNGVAIPRVSYQQATVGTAITSQSQLREGDLVFFAIGSSSINHVGIYIGNGQMINATTSKGITITDMTTWYWQGYYVTARRVIN
jgi:peptidoglycan DL-endopeptidase LytE